MKRLRRKASERIKLYHGTTDAFIESIVKNGIGTISDHGNMVTGPKSGRMVGTLSSTDVYLSDSESIAELYADRASAAYGGEGIVLEVMVDTDYLGIDDDFYNLDYDEEGDEYCFSFEGVCLSKDQYENPSYKESLILLNSVSHSGGIKPEDILNLQYFINE
jgi:hypothetical protein